MAIYHCSIKIISRGKGKSAVAAAAYRSGEKLINDYDGITHDYTRKSGISHTEILLPSHAPPEFSDRSTLWNSVEKIEKSKNSQLAREIEIAIPKELSREQQISLVREYVKENFVSAGMCADFAIHDKKDGNPHAHILLTMRPLEQDGSWGAKSKKEYTLDKNGEKIKLKNGNYKTRKIDTVDWNNKEKAEVWRSSWAEITNKYLSENAIDERIDHRSFARQGIDQIPSIHLGVAASQMERKGIATERGQINREISRTNKILAEIKGKITRLKTWIEKVIASSKSNPIPSENIIELLLKITGDKSDRWQKVRALKDISHSIVYLQNNGITTVKMLDTKIDSLNDNYFSVRQEIKTRENRTAQLKKNLEQADNFVKYRPVYKEYQAQKPKDKAAYHYSHTSELIMFDTARNFIKKVAVHGKVPTNQWKAELEKLTAEKQGLYQVMYHLRDEVKTVEKIKKNIDYVLQQETVKNHTRKIEHEL